MKLGRLATGGVAGFFTSFKAIHTGYYTEKGFREHRQGPIRRLLPCFVYRTNRNSSEVPSGCSAGSATLGKLHLADGKTEAKRSERKPPTTWMVVSEEPMATLGWAEQMHLNYPLLPYFSLAE